MSFCGDHGLLPSIEQQDPDDPEAEPVMVLVEDGILSMKNVEAYFTNVVANRRGLPSTIRATLPALQWYCDNMPQYGGTNTQIRGSCSGKYLLICLYQKYCITPYLPNPIVNRVQ